MSPALNAIADRSGLHRHLLYIFIYGTTLTYIGLIASADKVVICSAVLLRSVVDPPVVALLSQLTITWLNSVGRSIYGRMRGWGSLGWGVTTLLSGRLYAGGGYSLLFTLAALINLLMLPFVVSPHRTTETHQLTHSCHAGASSRPDGEHFLYFVGMNVSWLQLSTSADRGNGGLSAYYGHHCPGRNTGPMSVIDWLLCRTNV
jgi:hypothetical protein